MTKRTFTFALALAALLVLALVAACGGGDNTVTPTAAPAARGSATTAAAATSPTAEPTKIGGSMILATTTSTQDTGLLDSLVPMFKAQTGIDVKVIAVGTGAALQMGAQGNADGVLVHAPSSEKPYVDSGDLIDGKLVMHNDFVLVGPPSDPAHVKGSADINAALKAIAASGPFFSRGDASGTNTKELALWKAANIDPKTQVKGYQVTGSGMGDTLNVTNQKNGYTLTDRGTYLALKKTLDLQIVFENGPALINIYHVYVVNPAKHPGVHVTQAEAWDNFIVSPAIQAFIGDFKKAEYGQALFIADAGKDESTLTK